MSKLRFSAVASILTGLCLACSGSNGTSDARPASNDSSGSAGAIAFDALPAKYAAAACTAYQNCSGPILVSLFLNGADCASSIAPQLENGAFALMQQKIAAGTIRYDGNKAQACLDALSKLSCDGLLTRDQPECLAALDGLVAQDGDCDLNEECAGSALCRSSTGTCPGRCVPLLSAGQACTADGDCDNGLQCSGTTKLCVRPAAIGEACEYGSPPCGPGAICLGKDDTAKTPGTCRTATEAFSAAAGAACDPATGILCAPGVSCVADHLDPAIPVKLIWTCVKSGAYAAGAACKPGLPDACASGNYCLAGTGPTALDGICTAIPQAKQACGTGIGAQCQPGAVCVAGLCQDFAANGVSCTGDAMCYSGYCGATGGCQPRLPCTQ